MQESGGGIFDRGMAAGLSHILQALLSCTVPALLETAGAALAGSD